MASKKAIHDAALEAKGQASTAALAKVRGLLAMLAELRTKEGELLAEIEALSGGGVGIGEQVKAATLAFEDAYATRYQGGYVWRKTQDVPHMKRLLKLLGLDELRARFGIYVRNDDPFFKRARHSFGAFVASVNQHADQADEIDGFSLEAPVVADCRHVPSCTSDQEHTRRKMADVRGASAF